VPAGDAGDAGRSASTRGARNPMCRTWVRAPVPAGDAVDAGAAGDAEAAAAWAIKVVEVHLKH
jgi:hypothetical protein